MSTENTAAPAAQAEREITIWASRGGQKAKITTAVTTWGELKPLVQRAGFDVDKLHAAESINKSDLVNMNAVLPTTAFVLFMRPKETKSGAIDVANLDFKGLRAQVKEDLEKDKAKAKAHYGDYTRVSKDVLRELVGSYDRSGVQEEPAAPTENNGIGEVVAAVAESKSAATPVTNLMRFETAEKALRGICDHAGNPDICERIEFILEEFPGLKVDIEEDTEEKPSEETVSGGIDMEAAKQAALDAMKAEQEAKEKEEAEKAAAAQAEKEAKAKAEKEENDRLEREANDFMSGYKR